MCIIEADPMYTGSYVRKYAEKIFFRIACCITFHRVQRMRNWITMSINQWKKPAFVKRNRFSHAKIFGITWE